MTDANMITLVKSMTGEDADAVVSAYLSMAKMAILNRAYPFVSDEELSGMSVPLRYHNLQCEIAAYLLNKRGAEGQTSHNENGINRSYENGGIPYSMLKQVMPFAAVPGGGADESTEP